MSTFEWMRRRELGLAPLRRAAPLIGGAVLLGFLGAGGGDNGAQRVDVGAHIFGFLSGGFVGIVMAYIHAPNRLGPRGQRFAGTSALVILASAWTWALLRPA